MSTCRLALANLPFPASPEDAVARAVAAVDEAAAARADLVCFPECYVPGYRSAARPVPVPEPAFLERAWAAVSAAAAKGRVNVVLGTERWVEGARRISALVLRRDGSVAGWQDKVQLDPSEDGGHVPGTERHVFRDGELTFGVVICHEGWRYPETVRWAARRDARLVLHPHFHDAEPGAFRPSAFADPRNTFHEKAALCRAAENGIWFATVNCAVDGAGTTSAVVRPDGTLHAFQPYGTPGLLVAELDLSLATGLLASRLREASIPW